MPEVLSNINGLLNSDYFELDEDDNIANTNTLNPLQGKIMITGGYNLKDKYLNGVEILYLILETGK